MKFLKNYENIQNWNCVFPFFQWLSVFASIYFVSSVLMSSCESYLLSQGIVSYWSDLGPIHGVRIGLSVIFVCTGVTCLIMTKRAQKRQKVATFEKSCSTKWKEANKENNLEKKSQISAEQKKGPVIYQELSVFET